MPDDMHHHATTAPVAISGRPLAWHLGILCTILLVPTFASAIFLLVRLNTAERTLHETTAREAAHHVAVVLDRELALLGQSLELLATSRHLQRGEFAAFSERAAAVALLPGAALSLRSQDGARLVDAHAPWGGTLDDISAKDMAAETQRMQTSGFLAAKGARPAAFTMTTPVPGRPYLLSLIVPVSALNDLLQKESIPPDMVASVVDQHGTVLARTAGAERYVGTPVLPGAWAKTRQEPEGWMRIINVEGIAVIMAYARSDIPGWTAGVFIPEAKFERPLRRSLWISAAFGISLAVLTALLASWFARSIARPIAALAGTTTKNGAAGAAAFLAPVREIDAVGRVLADVRAASSLQERERHLAEMRAQKLQAELMQVSRLSAMGAMAAALAHELNQPLTAAANFANAARRLLAADAPQDADRMEDAREAMASAAAEAIRAGTIVRNLRELVSRGDGQKLLCSLNTLVEASATLALSGAREQGVSIRLQFASALPDILVDRVQIQQVVVNLVRNATEAVLNAPRREVSVATSRLGAGWLEVSVTDTGPGMADELLSRLFDPFVTTKRDGMGVGLSICRFIVEQHGGWLKAENRSSGGAVFRFALPLPPGAGHGG